VRKAKLRNLRKHASNKVTLKAMRAYVKRRKASLAAAGEAGVATPLAAPPGEVTPLAAAAGEVTPHAAAGEAGNGEAVPGTPTPIPEDLWPAAGVEVAVGVEHLTHSLRLGETGVCEGPVPDDPLEVFVRLNTVGVLAPLRIPRSVLVPVGENMRAMRLWDKCSDSVKRQLLLKVGVRDPRDEVLPTTTCLSLSLWGEYVPIGLRTYEDACKIKFVQPAFVQAFEDGHEVMKRAEAIQFDDLDDNEVTQLEDQVQRQEMRHKLLTDWWSQNDVLLVCMCDEASGSVGLLALRKTPPSVRYYEASATK
jgi:hypothetical protein